MFSLKSCCCARLRGMKAYTWLTSSICIALPRHPDAASLLGGTTHTGTMLSVKSQQVLRLLAVLPSRYQKGQKSKTLWHKSQAKKPPHPAQYLISERQKGTAGMQWPFFDLPIKTWGLASAGWRSSLCAMTRIFVLNTPQWTPLPAVCPTGAWNRHRCEDPQQVAAVSCKHQLHDLKYYFPISKLPFASLISWALFSVSKENPLSSGDFPILL